MSIEAGLCKYAELNDKIKQELRTKKKVTVTAALSALYRLRLGRRQNHSGARHPGQ